MPTRGNYQATGLGLFGDNAKDGMWSDAPHPLLIPPTWGFGEIIDFNDGGFAADRWTITVVEVGTGDSTIEVIDKEGGQVRVNTAGNDNDGAQAQADWANINLASTNKVWLDFRVEVTEEVSVSDLFLGLSITDTSLIASPAADYAGWFCDTGDANLDFRCDKSGGGPASTTAADTLVLDVPHILGFKWDGSTLTPYADGVAATAITTFIPDDVLLKISFGYLNGDAVQNEGMNIDFIRYVSVFDRS